MCSEVGFAVFLNFGHVAVVTFLVSSGHQISLCKYSKHVKTPNTISKQADEAYYMVGSLFLICVDLNIGFCSKRFP